MWPYPASPAHCAVPGFFLCQCKKNLSAFAQIFLLLHLLTLPWASYLASWHLHPFPPITVADREYISCHDMLGHACLKNISVYKFPIGLDLKNSAGISFPPPFPPKQGQKWLMESSCLSALFSCHSVMEHSFGRLSARQRCLWDF